MTVLGTVLGQDEFVEVHSGRTSLSHETLLDPMLSDVQSAWVLLLHCANVRPRHLRVVRPEMVQRYVEGWRCLGTILGVHPALRSCSQG